MSGCAICGADIALHPASCPGKWPIPVPQDRIIAAVAYCFIFPAVIILYLPRYRQNSFVRFHAAQSILISVLEIGLAVLTYVILNLSAILGLVFGSICGIGAAILWALLVIKALQGEWFRLPWISDRLGFALHFVTSGNLNPSSP
jgi:uncharacterized membrane protein